MPMKFLHFLFCFIFFLSAICALPYEYSVSENAPVGKVIVNLASEFSIDPRSNSQSLKITSAQATEGAEFFGINSSTGELYVVSPPDRDRLQLCEETEECIVSLMIAHGDIQNPEVTTIQIRIIDINDNTPMFPEKIFETSIREEMEPNLVTIPLPAAYDPDFGGNTVQRYSLDGRNDEISPFGVELKDEAPQLVVHQKLDRERKASYKFRILARDGGRPQLTGTLSIRVKVEDLNDHKPVFEKASYSTIILESTPEGSTILRLKASDKDSGVNGRVSYKMARPRNHKEALASKYFDVYSSNGEARVVIKKRVDIDSKPNLLYRFHVTAYDHGANSLETRTKVTIRVRDVNDEKPKIKVSYIKHDSMVKTRGLLTENEEKVFVALITVTDRDSGPGGLVSCKLDNDLFYLQDIERNTHAYKSSGKWQEKKYKLLTRQGIDREKTEHVSFQITCHDNAASLKSMTKLVSTARIELRVVDKNDEAPVFSEERYTFYLRENLAKAAIEVQVGQVKATDRDEGINAKISYFLVEDPSNAFRIDIQNGVIYARRAFDREATERITLKVKAVDGGLRHQKSATAEVKVIIADVNDNAPVFKATDYHFTVVENSRALKVGRVEAVDEDRDSNAHIEYRIISRASEARKFSINRNSGFIHLNSKLDRERQEQYVFHVVAVDKPRPGQARNTGTATVTVTVLDENDNRPQIFSPSNNEIKIIDNTEPIGKDLFTVRASDQDEGINGTVSYSIVRGAEGFFQVDKSAGIFYVMQKLEGLRNKLFAVVVMAQDNGREISLNSTVTVRIRVQSEEQGQLPLPEHEAIDVGDTGRTLIVVAAAVLLLLVLAAVALLVMLRMRRVPHSGRRNNDEMKRKWKDGLMSTVSETYVCARADPKSPHPKCQTAVGDEEKVDDYLLESADVRIKEGNYNSLNFYKGDSSPDKTQPEHTYYEVAKSKNGSLDNYASYEKDDMCQEFDGLTDKRSPFLGDMRVPGMSDADMTMVAAKRRQEKPFTPYIEASFV